MIVDKMLQYLQITQDLSQIAVHFRVYLMMSLFLNLSHVTGLPFTFHKFMLTFNFHWKFDIPLLYNCIKNKKFHKHCFAAVGI